MDEVREALSSRRDLFPDAGGEGGDATLPANPSPATAEGAGGFDSRSLTEIAVKSGFESRPDASASMGGPTGMGRSDGGERTAAEGAADPSAPASPERASEEVGGGPAAAAPQCGGSFFAVERQSIGRGCRRNPARRYQEPPDRETADLLRSEAATRRMQARRLLSPSHPAWAPLPHAAALHRLHFEYTARQAAAELDHQGKSRGDVVFLKIKWRRADAVADRQLRLRRSCASTTPVSVTAWVPS